MGPESAGVSLEQVVTSTPPVEASPASSVPERVVLTPDQLRNSETLKKLPLRTQISHRVSALQESIRQACSQGLFRDVQQPALEQALVYGQSVGEQSPQQLWSLIELASQVPDVATRWNFNEVNKYIKVEVEGNLYTRDEFNVQVQSATNSNDQSRLEALQKGKFGFVFAEAAETSVAVSVDQVINQNIVRLTEKIQKGQEEGRDLKSEGRLLSILQLAASANGEAGALLKALALEELKASGTEGLELLQKGLGPQVKEATAKIVIHLNESGLNPAQIGEFVKLLQSKDWVKILNSRYLDKVEGLDKLLFGKEKTDDEVKEILQANLGNVPEANLQSIDGKKVAWAVLLALLLAVASPFILEQQLKRAA